MSKKSAKQYSGCASCAMKSKFEPRDPDRGEKDPSLRISHYIHCAKCDDEEALQVLREEGIMSYLDYQQVEVGFTDVGIQVWCKRHNHNIIHFDFEGMSHPFAVKQAS